MSEQVVFGSPDSLLASFFSQPGTPSKLILLTGDSGAGKTTWCQALIVRAREMDIIPGGLISPAVFESRTKIGIDLIDITSGAQRRLATRRTARPSTVSGRETLNWLFDDLTLSWGNEILQHLPKTDLLILDELGPLELLENEGLTSGLKIIDDHQHRLACVVVRPSLLQTALVRWPWGTVIDVSESASGVRRVTA